MNKYEQLIEYIINNQEDKARELFHSIVVAKSRDIYESLMDETVDQYDQQGGLVDDVESDELGEADDEFDAPVGDDMGGEEEMDDMGGDDMGGDDEFATDDGMDGGDEFGDDEFGGDDMGSEEGGLADKFADIKSAIDELEAEFQAITGEGDDGVDPDSMGDGEIEGGDEMAADDAGEDFGGAPEEVGAEEEPAMESANPFAKKSGSGKAASGSGKAASGSGKSGSGKAASGSGKSGSGKAASGSGKSGSGNPFAKKGSGSGKKMESRTAAELMREYVEKISAGHGPEKAGEAEGNEVGSDRKSFPVNKTTPVAGKNDMGGTASNILSGKGNDTSEKDGQTSKAKAGGFMKAPTAIPGSERNVNKVGGNKGAQDFYNTKAKAKSAEGSTTDGSVPVKKDSLGYPNK